MSATSFISDTLGNKSDAITLILGGKTIVIAESWEHIEGVLSQPCSWQIRLGWGDVAAGLLKTFKPNDAFRLRVGPVIQASGNIDSIGAEQAAGGATELTIGGRDALAPLQDTFVATATGVNVTTYPDLVWYALQQCGIAPKGTVWNANNPATTAILQVDNSANRALKAGVPVKAILPHRTPEQILANAGLVVGVVHTTPQAKLHETWHQFLRRYLDRAGLMIWAAADGSFVLGSPNGNQQPTYNLIRGTGDPSPGPNVVACSYHNDTTHRHTEAIVYGRGGGRVLGRVKVKGSYVDTEMRGLGYLRRTLVYRDANVSSTAEALYFARRKIAEERRSGWRLEYTVAGLTLPFAGTNGADRAVIVPDTIVSVNDRELGLNDNFYIETVVRRRSPQTTTTIRLMRPEDLVFGGVGDDEAS